MRAELSGKQILVLEDDLRFRNSIKFVLSGYNYTFFEAESVEDAILQLNQHQNIKVILLDLSLSGSGGKDFLEQIKDKIDKYRIIILTAHDEYLAAEAAKEYKVFNYLPKAVQSFHQSLRFTVDQAFNDIQRQELRDKNKVLLDIQQRINEEINDNSSQEETNAALHKILNSICESVNAIVGTYKCHIRLYNLSRGDFDLAGFAGPDDEVKRIFEASSTIGEVFSGTVAVEKKSMLFEDLQNDEDFKAFKKTFLEGAPIPEVTKRYLNTVQSAYIVPITTHMFGDETDAVFNVSSNRLNFFTKDKQRIIKEFVTQATTAITKAWQKVKKSETHQDYQKISEVLEDISKELRGEDVKSKVYDIVIEGISRIIKPETISIYLYNKATKLLDTKAEYKGNKKVHPRKEGNPTTKGLTGWVYTESRPLRLPNLQNRDGSRPQSHPRYSKNLETDYIVDIPSGRVEHYLGVPLIIGDEVIGAVQLLNKKSDYYLAPNILSKERWVLERGFSQDDENVLVIAASHLAVAIKNAELIEERNQTIEKLNRTISQLDTLKDVGRYTSQEMPLDELLNRIIEEAAKNVQADICLLFMLDESKSKVVLEQAYGIPKAYLQEAHYRIGEGLTGSVAQTGRALLKKAEPQKGKYGKEILQYLQENKEKNKTIESLMIVPVKAKGELLGVFKAINKKGSGEQYNLEDLNFFETFANYVGIAIENAQRYELASKKAANAESNFTLSNLVASVAHELNNTYGLIPDDIEELKEMLPQASPEVTDILDEIKDLATQTVYYTNQIGAYSMGRRGEKIAVNINDEIITATKQIPEFRKPENFEIILLKFNLSPSPLICSLYVNPFIGTLRNIIINAYQALEGKEQGEIVITTYEDTVARLAKIEIADNGCGIKEEFKARVFDPEFTTKNKGSGIGLWLAKRHIQSIGGNISFYSSEGKGTTFILKIPLDSTA
jgi:signal transduction histidine kinase/CheY-like chemotaxis protein